MALFSSLAAAQNLPSQPAPKMQAVINAKVAQSAPAPQATPQAAPAKVAPTPAPQAAPQAAAPQTQAPAPKHAKEPHKYVAPTTAHEAKKRIEDAMNANKIIAEVGDTSIPFRGYTIPFAQCFRMLGGEWDKASNTWIVPVHAWNDPDTAIPTTSERKRQREERAAAKAAQSAPAAPATADIQGQIDAAVAAAVAAERQKSEERIKAALRIMCAMFAQPNEKMINSITAKAMQ